MIDPADSRVLVLGLGSVLMGDDAAGPWAVRLLEAGYVFPEEVALLDGGTPGPELAHVVAGRQALVVIDTLRHQDLPPGSVRVLRKEEILRTLPRPRMSPHDPSLKDALAAAAIFGQVPGTVVLVGVVPDRVQLGTGLTERVTAAMPTVVAAVLAELAALGCPATPTERPEEPDVWWERALTAAG